MAKYHSVQEKAHNIIRDVIGPNRLPTFEDRSSLPYIEAIYMETLRWGIPVPLSVPHRSTEDEIYKGYFIPAGTVIIPNVWCVCWLWFVHAPRRCIINDQSEIETDSDEQGNGTRRRKIPRSRGIQTGEIFKWRRQCEARRENSGLWLWKAVSSSSIGARQG